MIKFLRAFFQRPKLTPRKRLGMRGEEVAVRLLKAKGYTILARNVRYKHYEIDIVARDGFNLCFVEVKSGYKLRPVDQREGIPVHRDQKIRILRAARIYVRQIGYPRVPYRFDMVEVTFLRRLPFLRAIRHTPGFWDAHILRRKN